MRILYIDIDTLRPDHLGCYGYHRNTSPNSDALARQALHWHAEMMLDAARGVFADALEEKYASELSAKLQVS